LFLFTLGAARPVAKEVEIGHGLAIRHLMLNPEDGEGAFETVRRWAEQQGNAEVREWIDLAENNEDVGYHPSAGFVKYGFVHALSFCRHESSSRHCWIG